MNRETFDYLLDRYLTNQCTEEEKALVESWYSLVGTDKEMPKTTQEWEWLKQQLWEKIRNQVAISAKNSTFKFNITKVAASILLLLTIGISYFYFQKEKNEPFVSETRYQNTESVKKEIKLADGSKIILFPNSKLYIEAGFNTLNRTVKLIGDAQFDIAPNAQKPFYVEAGNTLTKVIGTVFTVKAASNSTIEVEVKEGLVAVFEKNTVKKTDNGVVLTPNQKVAYIEKQSVFVTGIVSEPKIIEKETEQINFDYQNIALEKVITDMEKAYGIEIIIENEKIKSCKITGDLNGDTLYDQLDILKFTLGIDYQIKGTTLLLSGNGC